MGVINDTFSALGKVKEIADKMANLDLKEAIVELREKLQDVRDEGVKFREENEKLKAENKRLSEPSEVHFKDGFYFTRDASDDEPLCPGCQDTKKVQVHLVEAGHTERRISGNRWKCPSCKVMYK